jgi:hypothetical protein
MEQKTKIIIAAAVGLGGLGYFLYKKGLFGKKEIEAPIIPGSPIAPTTKPSVPSNTVIVAPATTKTYIYPAGLVNGDYVKFGTAADVYLLHNGQKLPITKEWWDANAWDKWDTVKFLAPAVALDIPTGKVL